MPEASQGSIFPDGKSTAYVRTLSINEWATFRLYRGGDMASIWIFNNQTHDIEEIPSGHSNNLNPVWINNDFIYFLSDRDNHYINVYKYNRHSHQVVPVTFYKDFDVKTLYSNGNQLAYEQPGKIFILDPTNDQSKHIPVYLKEDPGGAQQLIIPAAAELKKYTNRIVDLSVDNNRNVIVSTLGGLYAFDSSFNLIFRYDAYTPADLGKKRISFVCSIYKLPNENFFVPLADSLCILDIKRKKLESIDRVPGDEWKLLKLGNKVPNIILNLNKDGQSTIGNYIRYQDSTHLNAIDLLKQKVFNFSIPSAVKNEIQWKSRIAFMNESTICINSSYQNGLILLRFNAQTSAIVYEGKCLPGIQCKQKTNGEIYGCRA